ncbi:hypothetical protein C5167_014486 [Papaver somniferum]|uniref:Uncharacterized protein n=1 Tax=Papaver somniferum TaxID=3469 RepID=A0A4Y7J780_PAPSO|nr:hypothetical protein C5167_014486 [Papaver somniferum]
MAAFFGIVIHGFSLQQIKEGLLHFLRAFEDSELLNQQNNHNNYPAHHRLRGDFLPSSFGRNQNVFVSGMNMGKSFK